MFEDPYGILKLNSAKILFPTQRKNKLDDEEEESDNNKKIKLICRCDSYVMFKYWENDPFDYIYLFLHKNNLN